MKAPGGSRGEDRCRGKTAARRVVVVAYPQANFLDVAGPCEVFNAAKPALPPRDAEDEGYAIEIVSATRESTIGMSCGVGIVAHRPYEQCQGPIDTLLVAGGPGVWAVARDAEFLGWLRRTAPGVRRLGSVCTGAFVLAAAGLLDGHRAADPLAVMRATGPRLSEG